MGHISRDQLRTGPLLLRRQCVGVGGTGGSPEAACVWRPPPPLAHRLPAATRRAAGRAGERRHPPIGVLMGGVGWRSGVHLCARLRLVRLPLRRASVFAGCARRGGNVCGTSAAGVARSLGFTARILLAWLHKQHDPDRQLIVGRSYHRCRRRCVDGQGKRRLRGSGRGLWQRRNGSDGFDRIPNSHQPRRCHDSGAFVWQQQGDNSHKQDSANAAPIATAMIVHGPAGLLRGRLSGALPPACHQPFRRN